jgi:hypothetical protein
VAIFAGCSHTEKVVIPPKVVLEGYRHIGVIEFSTNAEDELKPYVTQKFIQNVQSAQPGTRMLELGSKAKVLHSVGRKEFDLEAIKAIGKTFNVDAVILGHLEISEIKPSLRVSTGFHSLQAKARIEALLRARLLETESGATLWTNSTSGETTVARVKLRENGYIKVGISDPKEKYGKLVPELVYVNTLDFWPRYEYVKVK